MKNRLFTALLAALMLFSLCACGSGDGSSEVVESSTFGEPKAIEKIAADTEESAAEEQEEASGVEEESGYASITYPIEGDHSFSMTSVKRMNVAEALGDQDYSATISYAALEEATGVHIDFEMLAETSYEETLNLRMASQDYPDIFSQSVASYQQKLEKAIAEEILIDMSEYLEYAPDWADLLERNETYRENITNSDGSIAQMVNCTIGKTTQQGLLRGDWLDALNLDSPTTIEELTEVLRAFKESYGTTNALLINSDLGSAAEFAFNFSAQGFRMLSFQLKEPGSNEVVAGVATEAYVEYLEYLHSLYEEGLITDDFVSTSKENGNWESAFYSGACGVWQDDCKYADAAYAAMAENAGWDAVPFAFSGEAYHMVSTNPVGLTTTYISTTCAEPEVAMEFLNYGFTEEGKKLVNYGIEDTTYTIDSDGNIAFTDLLMKNPDGYTYDQAQVLYLVSNWMPTEQDDSYLTVNYTGEAIEAINLWSSVGDGSMTIPQAAQPGGDEMMEIFTMASDSLTYLSTIAPKVILGTATADDYRAAVQECMDNMNLAVITDKYQAAYDAYMGS